MLSCHVTTQCGRATVSPTGDGGDLEFVVEKAPTSDRREAGAAESESVFPTLKPATTRFPAG